MAARVHWELVNEPFGDPALYADFMFEARALLFDLGDIAALPTRKILRLTHVFVSHAHMDHFVGFDRLLRTVLGREKTLRLFGPPGFIDRIWHKLQAYTWNLLHSYEANLVIVATEVRDGGILSMARFESRSGFAAPAETASADRDGTLVAEDGFRVRCATLDHSTPSLAFAFEESVRINVWKNRLDQLGLAVGPWLREVKAAVIAGMPDDTPVRVQRRAGSSDAPTELPLGEIRRAALSVSSGQKVAYVVDARYHEDNAQRIDALAHGADILFIESPFLQADAAIAARKNHLTAWQAGAIARRAQVKAIMPFHFSPRYEGRADALRAEAQAAFLGAEPSVPA